MAARKLLFALAALLVTGIATEARADVCSVSMPTIAFGNVSPVSGQDYYATGTLSVTCTFVILIGNVIVLPNITGCANIGTGAESGPRSLVYGNRSINFGLYRAPTYAPGDVWGHYLNNTALMSNWAGLLAIGTGTQTYPVYAKIAASDLATAAIDSDAGTVYSASFVGSFNYASSSIITLPCQSSGIVTPFTVNVVANIANDCRINTTPVAFGSRGLLTTATRATGTVSVLCTAGNSYRVALNGGGNGTSPADRKMKNAATGETIDYRLSASLDGVQWGDGSNGTSMVTGNGIGTTQQLTVFGVVPQQLSPSPGDYSDKIIATVYF